MFKIFCYGIGVLNAIAIMYVLFKDGFKFKELFPIEILIEGIEYDDFGEIITEAEVRIIRYLRRRYGLSDSKILGIADDAVSMLSPELFEEFAVPYQKEVTQRLSPPNGRVNYHLCGQSQHLLGSIRKHINPLYMDISYFTDLGYASRIMKDTILLGGPHPRVVLRESREKIRQNVVSVLKQGIQHGLYIFGSGTSAWDPETPVENIHYTYSVVKEYT